MSFRSLEPPDETGLEVARAELEEKQPGLGIPYGGLFLVKSRPLAILHGAVNSPATKPTRESQPHPSSQGACDDHEKELTRVHFLDC